MLAFIRASFAESGGAPLHIAGAHYGETDAFFEANGSFNALLGCNTWTAAALRRGRPPDRLVEPAACHARLFAGAAQLRGGGGYGELGLD